MDPIVAALLFGGGGGGGGATKVKIDGSPAEVDAEGYALVPNASNTVRGVVGGNGTVAGGIIFSEYSADTRMSLDDVLSPNAAYFLGTSGSVTITLPETGAFGDEIVVVFYTGVFDTQLTVNGDVIGTVPTPMIGQRIELNFMWDGVRWALVANVMEEST